MRTALRDGINKTRQQLPFEIDAWVLLPDHLHCVLLLPEGDADFAKHGYVERAVDWPYSTFHRYLKAGVYKTDWCGGENVNEQDFLE